MEVKTDKSLRKFGHFVTLLGNPLHRHQVDGGRSKLGGTTVVRVAELGSLSSGAKMAMKIFVKHVLTIFASNASFLRVIANLQN